MGDDGGDGGVTGEGEGECDEAGEGGLKLGLAACPCCRCSSACSCSLLRGGLPKTTALFCGCCCW
jgi:hypothetical protein